MEKVIVLIGMMGSGKSTIGEMLAQNLNYDFIDIDKEIEKTENKTISQIFEECGEIYFRKCEIDKIKDFVKHNNLVLSLGGGAFENKETQELLKNKKTVYLKTNSSTIFKRIKNETHRPLLKENMTVEKINSIIEKRKQNYENIL